MDFLEFSCGEMPNQAREARAHDPSGLYRAAPSVLEDDTALPSGAAAAAAAAAAPAVDADAVADALMLLLILLLLLLLLLPARTSAGRSTMALLSRFHKLLPQSFGREPGLILHPMRVLGAHYRSRAAVSGPGAEKNS